MDVRDELAEFAINFLLSGHGSARQLLAVLVQRWPQKPALEYVLVLSLAASGIENILTGGEAERLSRDAWRMAALIGADLYDAQALGMAHYSGHDLIRYWRAHDPLFLTG